MSTPKNQNSQTPRHGDPLPAVPTPRDEARAAEMFIDFVRARGL